MDEQAAMTSLGYRLARAIERRDGHWLLRKARQRGYQRIMVGGHLVLAPRAVWRLTMGVWPRTILYRWCDAPTCVKPSCFREGVRRLRRVPNIAQRKLTPDQVRHLRAERARGAQVKSLAIAFGISQTAASLVARGKTYRWVTTTTHDNGAGGARAIEPTPMLPAPSPSLSDRHDKGLGGASSDAIARGASKTPSSPLPPFLGAKSGDHA